MSYPDIWWRFRTTWTSVAHTLWQRATLIANVCSFGIAAILAGENAFMLDKMVWYVPSGYVWPDFVQPLWINTAGYSTASYIWPDSPLLHMDSIIHSNAAYIDNVLSWVVIACYILYQLLMSVLPGVWIAFAPMLLSAVINRKSLAIIVLFMLIVACERATWEAWIISMRVPLRFHGSTTPELSNVIVISCALFLFYFPFSLFRYVANMASYLNRNVRKIEP